MRKRHFGRLLSSALSVALAFTSVIPSYAMEGVDADDLAQAQEDAEAEEEETEEPAEEPVEEVPEELAATPAEEEEEDVLVEEDEDDVLVGEAPYTVTFDADGGLPAPEAQTISTDSGKATEPETDPAKDGYTFEGWYLVTDGTMASTQYDFDTVVSDNITIKAKYSPNTYKVTFDAGTGVTVDPAEIDVTYGSAYSTNAFPIPSKAGYDFEGWFDENDADHETAITKDSTYAIAGNQTLVAYYTAWPYTIAFDKNDDAATGTMESISATVGTDKTLTENAFTNEGKTFAGWATSSSGDVKYADQATNVQEIPEEKNGTVTLYAKWTSSTPETVAITVKNVIDGGAAVDAGSVDVEVGTDIATALTEAGKDEVTGKTFGGYFTNEGCTEALGTVNASTATTVYAKFTTETTPAEDFEVTFWDGDKELTGLKQTVKSGEKATKPATDPTKTNYEFKGWFTTDELSEEFDFNTPITAATKIYAKFEGKPIKITLDKNCEDDVTGLPAEDENHFVGITVKYGEKYTGLESLTRVGYDFVGWFTAKEHGSEITAYSDVKFTKDATLYARWKEKVVDVSFDGNNANAELSFVETEVPYGSKVQSVLPKITKTPEGYKFDGWYATKNGTELSDKVDDETVVVDGKTYYVKWTPITYTIKFDVNGGTGKIDDQERTFDDKVALPATTGISKEHYSFAGWNTVKAPTAKNPGVSYENLSIDNVAAVDKATVTLYAQWAGLTYDLTYDYGYSVGSTPVTSTDVVTYGEVYPAPKADKLAGNPGHYLKGWKNGEATVDITKPFKGDGNVTLTADWGDVTYKATFNSNNSKKLTKTITLNAEHTDAISFVREDLFKEADAAGLTFEGWATADAFYAKGDNDLTEKDLIDVLKGDKTSTTQEVTTVVYAQWASTGKYNIQLNANLPTAAKPEDLRSGVDGRVESVNFAEPFFLTGSEFRLDGYALVGWTYKNAKGKTVTVKPAAKLVSLTTEKDKTVEVNAKWKATSYTLKYYLNGGTANKKTKTTVKFKVDENTRKGVPFLNYKESEGSFVIDESNLAVTRRGYTFAGWGYADGYYGKDRYWNMTVVANWNPNSYTLHLDADGGTIEGSGSTKDITTNFENSNNLFGYVPTKAGYTFTGWTGKGVNGKAKKFAPTDNALLKLLAFDDDGTTVTLKATYKANTNKIEYYLDGGTINKKAPKSYVTNSEKNSAIPDPVKAGYKFDGWIVYDGEYDNVTSTAFDATTKKIKAGVSGKLVFEAQWSTATYGFEFKSADGEKTYTVSDYTGIEYTDPVDFTAAAEAIEASEGFTGSVKGFALAKNSKKVKYALNKTYTKLGAKSKDETITLYVVGQAAVHRIAYNLDGGTLKNALYEYKTPTKADLKLKTTATKKGFTFKGFTCRDEDKDYVAINDKGFVTAIKKDATKDLEFTAVYDNEVSYSIVAMPNASDVTDDYGKVNAKKGVQFEMDGDKLFPISNDIDVINLTEYLNWKRPGYTLAGFATSKSGKKAIDTLGGLSYNKKKVATVYAIWTANDNTVYYEDEAIILRDGVKAFTADEDDLGISLYGKVDYKYGKAVSTKKLKSVKGLTFKGWMLDYEFNDYEGLKATYTDKTKKYVKTIAKNNTVKRVYLIPVFEENYYNLYVNPNGGTYKGSKKKQLFGKVYYSDYAPVDEIISGLSRSGYGVDGVSTTKNYKGYVSPYRNGLSAKNKGSVTVNALWYKTNVAKPTVSATISGTGMGIYFGYSSKADDKVYYEIQYSPSSSFTYNVQTITLEADAWEGDNLKPISRTVVEGKDYYLRARMFRKDSTGKYVSSAWSATARASRAGVATDAYTVKNVIDNKAVAAGTVNVPKDGSMKIKDVLDAAKKNEKEGYDFGGYFTDDKCTTALEATATTLEAKVVYVKFTKKAVAAKVTVTFNAGDGKFADNTSTKQVEFTVGGTYGTDLPTVETVPENKEFAGWFDAQTGGNKITSSTEVSATLTTIYAQYTDATATTVNVTFNAGDGKFADNSSTKVVQFTIGGTYGADLPTVETVPENKEFAGWFDAQTGGNKITSSTEVTATLTTIYAQYTDAKVTVTFNAGDGKFDDNSSTKEVQFTIGGTYGTDLPTVATVPENKEFAGWFDAQTGGNKITSSSEVTGTLTTIYAQYTDAAPTTITINLDVTNGTGATVSAASVTAGTDGKLSSLPELATQATDGSKFLGWFTTKTDDGAQVTTETVLEDGATIYARFTAVSVITVGGTLTHNGTAFDTSALTATVKYADDSTADVTAKATFAISPENPSGTTSENVSVVATYCGNSSVGTEMTATYVAPSAP
ncbi:MAG: InlB B-repeat-containing protein [Butyrivibrio sp.]|nr:InlB B-repeat-containing protein [Butyrivibrio sp.]